MGGCGTDPDLFSQMLWSCDTSHIKADGSASISVMTNVSPVEGRTGLERELGITPILLRGR
jgi:hypothetical protein